MYPLFGLLPGILIVVCDLRRDAPPRFSITHCVFLISVLYRISYRAAQIDTLLLDKSESLLARFAAAMTGGAATALVGAPFDAVKTRLMNQNQQARPLYAGPLDCAARVARVEGAAALWKGLLPVYCRQGPFNVLNYLIMEQLTLALLDRSV